MSSRRLRLGLLQFAPALRDRVANVRRVTDAAADAELDLLLTPELSLTGYGLGDDVHALAVDLDDPAAVPDALLEARPAVVTGWVERGARGIPYNTAVLSEGGRIRHRHRKIYLPTYGMFDEGRFFGRGDRVDAAEIAAGWRVGILICEDFWHPALVYLLAVQRIDLLLVQAAAPGRGVWEAGESGGIFASSEVWTRMARTTAQTHGIYVALANRVGAEDGFIFAGGSVIVGPSGEPLAAAEDDETLLTAELSLDEVERARRPYAHARDEDPHLVLRELARLLRASS